MKLIKLNFAAAAMAVVVAIAPMTAEASSTSKEAGSDFGVGMVTVFANVAYMPVKVVYGVLGGITGCFAFVLSGGNRAVADGVWVPSLGGDYVLTMDMVTGREPVHFNGVRGHRAKQPADVDEPPADDEARGSSF